MPKSCINISLLVNNDSKSQSFEKLLSQTISNLNINAYLDIVNDENKIKSLGVSNVPCLLINNNIEFEGDFPSTSELKKMVSKYTNQTLTNEQVSIHHIQISDFCNVLAEPINIVILERILNSKCCITSFEVFNDLNIEQDELIQRLKEIKCAGFITGTFSLPIKFCSNKINVGIAKILFSNLFK